MPDWASTWLPFHWLRPWALWGLLLALFILIWGRRPPSQQHLRGVIDAHLLPHLLVHRGRAGWLRPTDTLALALACFCVALAGPAWQREAPPLAQEQAPLMLVLDLTPSMDAVDWPPSRLARARAKLHTLLQQRRDAPTGLVVYGGSAHLVLPPTQDHKLLATYLESLSTTLMPQPGAAPAQALQLALNWLARQPVPGTVLFITAEWPADDIARAQALLSTSRHRLIVLAVGDAQGGPIRGADGRYLTDAQGRTQRARLDVAALSALRERTGAALVTASQDDTDLARVQALMARYRADAIAQDPTQRWRDAGAVWIWPGLLALLLSFRRGWVMPGRGLGAWWAAFLLGVWLGAAPAPGWAEPMAPGSGPGSAPGWRERVVGWWLTPDQQGRWWLQQGQPARAAQHFADPLWRGIAQAQAGQWQAAADAFARSDSAAGWFNQAQMLARMGQFGAAVAAYDQALLRAPGWPQAISDRERVRGLIPPDKPLKADEAGDPQGEADGSQPRQRRAKKPGPPRPLSEAEVAELWLQRLDTSPAGFLQRKFALQAQSPVSAPAAATPTRTGR
jgi:Ca-activated chloride channel family protein